MRAGLSGTFAATLPAGSSVAGLSASASTADLASVRAELFPDAGLQVTDKIEAFARASCDPSSRVASPTAYGGTGTAQASESKEADRDSTTTRYECPSLEAGGAAAPALNLPAVSGTV